jgi:CheY-like chemotaxis protein
LDHNRLLRRKVTHDRAGKDGCDLFERQMLRVLVVDTAQDSADALRRLVRRWGYAVRVAHDGHAALRVAAIQHPDVVLLDMELFSISGCQVARHLRVDFPGNDFFMIAMTELELANDERRRQCMEAGIDLLLIKPVDPDVVETLLMLECARVNEMADRRRRRHAAF